MLSAFSISGIVTLLTMATMALVMFSRDRLRIQVIWGIFCVLVAAWGLGAFQIGSSSSADQAVLWWKIAYVGVIFIPTLFTHFVHEFLGRKNFLFIASLYAISVVYLVCNLFTDLFINDVQLVFGSIYYLVPTPLYNSFMALWPILVIYTQVILFWEYGHASTTRRIQIGYLFFGTFIGFLGGSFSFLPVYGFDIYPYENAAIALGTIIVGYAILRFQLLSLKVVGTQAFFAALWTFLLVRMLLEPTFSVSQVIDAILLAVTIIIGLFLIRSVYREIEQRERIQQLSDEKSEFMTFASHEIRNPITAMRGYASLIADGTVDHASPEVKAVAQKILIGGNDVLNLIAQFLSKSKMELGQISYNSAPFDLGAAASSIADGYVPHAELRGLTLEKKIDASHQFIIKADEGKVKEVIGNLIDNSLKYTVHGGVTVAVERHGVAVRLTISDTGVGIASETLPHLFKKFSRADAQKVNLLGTGVGLYLAKTFIEAMGGRIWAESEGKDKGSRFILEFPPAV